MCGHDVILDKMILKTFHEYRQHTLMYVCIAHMHVYMHVCMFLYKNTRPCEAFMGSHGLRGLRGLRSLRPNHQFVFCTLASCFWRRLWLVILVLRDSLTGILTDISASSPAFVRLRWRRLSISSLSLCPPDGWRIHGLHVGWFCCVSARWWRRCLRVEPVVSSVKLDGCDWQAAWTPLWFLKTLYRRKTFPGIIFLLHLHLQCAVTSCCPFPVTQFGQQVVVEAEWDF